MSKVAGIVRAALVSLLLVAVTSAAAPAPAAPAASPHDDGGGEPWKVWILGDSLTEGLYASSEGATFRSNLFGMLQAEKPRRQMATFWHRGCTLARLEARWSEFTDKPDVLFLEYGVNDLASDTCPVIPEEEYQARYGVMLDRMLGDAPGVRVVVGTIPWCGWPEGTEYRVRAVRFNAWIREEAQRRELAVADLWGATVDRPEFLSSPSTDRPFPPADAGDGFHPNDAGHWRIAATFYRAYRDHYGAEPILPGASVPR